MTLTERLSEYVRACFTGLCIESHEHEDAVRDIAQLCSRERWQLATWHVASGLSISGQPTEPSGGDSLAAIRALNTFASQDSAGLLVLVNFHRFLGSAEVVQALAQQISAGKQNRTFVVVLSRAKIAPGKHFVSLMQCHPASCSLTRSTRPWPVSQAQVNRIQGFRPDSLAHYSLG